MSLQEGMAKAKAVHVNRYEGHGVEERWKMITNRNCRNDLIQNKTIQGIVPNK